MDFSAITAGIGAAGSLLGGIMSGVQNRKNRKLVDKQLQENENLYNRDYYQDILSRSDVSRVLGRARDQYERAGQQAARTAAVTGATPESVAAAKKANAEAYANAVSDVAAQSSVIKDNAQQRYLNTKNQLVGSLMNQNGNSAASWATAAANSANLLMGALGGVGSGNESGNESGGTKGKPSASPGGGAVNIGEKIG